MTDKYGTDADHEEAGHDEMTEAETWHDDQPPVDDFADQPMEETATVSEESEMPEEEHTGEEVEEKKKSLLLPVAAGLGGLLFLGAVLYWQFGASASSTASVTPPMPPLSTAQKLPSVPAVAPKTAEADIENLRPAGPDTVAPTTSLVSAADTKPSQVAPAPVSASPTSGVAMPAPSPAAPVAAPAPSTTISAEALAKAPPVPVVTPPAPAAAPVAKDGTIDARLNALTAHVEDLQKALAQTTQQLGQISNMLAANAPVAASGAQPNTAVDDRLNKIEQQLMQMQHAVPVTAASPVVTQETPTAVVADATPEKPLVSTPASTHKHKSSVKHVSRVTHKTQSHAKTVPAHWVLRAATPDEAWVSTGAEAAELRHVQVGDSLPGVGRIRAIHQNGDSWVVEGSQGLIR